MSLSPQSYYKSGFKCLMVVFLCILMLPVSAIASEREELTIYVPSSQSGGADFAANALKYALEQEGLVANVRLVRSGGAGGLISLAQFIETENGNPNAVFLGSRTSMGASIFNRSDVSLLDTQPIARLMGPTTVVAVKADSKIATFEALAKAYKTNPLRVNWVGGSGGGQDELVLLAISQSLGVRRADINYHSIPGGGDAITQHMLDGQSTAMIQSFEEAKEAYLTGNIRILATIPSDAGNAMPTISSQLMSKISPDAEWRGIFASSHLSSEEQQALQNLFIKLETSPTWQSLAQENHWRNEFLAGEPFVRFVEMEAKTIREFHDGYPMSGTSGQTLSEIITRRYRWFVGGGFTIAALVLLLLVQRRRNGLREKQLADSLESAEAELEKQQEGSQKHINDKFSEWNLTDSESEIGWLLLKGLSFKDIAKLRGTSDRTVRQQARVVYAKSGLSNRSDLAAFFLEDFVFGMD